MEFFRAPVHCYRLRLPIPWQADAVATHWNLASNAAAAQPSWKRSSSALDLLVLAATSEADADACEYPSPPPSKPNLVLPSLSLHLELQLGEPILAPLKAPLSPPPQQSPHPIYSLPPIASMHRGGSTPPPRASSVDSDATAATSNSISSSASTSTTAAAYPAIVRAKKRAKLAVAPTSGAPQFKCSAAGCSAVFQRNQDYTRHYQSIHERVVVFACPKCPGTRFSRKVRVFWKKRCTRRPVASSVAIVAVPMHVARSSEVAPMSTVTRRGRSDRNRRNGCTKSSEPKNFRWITEHPLSLPSHFAPGFVTTS
ncbi:hypothetical protein BC830DRAFT_172327 [Chytriomyces sp. MP71]|nr:hypothetical protein BC830DRAFT_172327 [Chytriomyces sp. MP71]